MMQTTAPRNTGEHAFIKGVHGVRYQVKDVARAIEFYTQHLGFRLEHQQLPAFANISLGDGCTFATRWRPALAVGRSRSRTDGNSIELFEHLLARSESSGSSLTCCAPNWNETNSCSDDDHQASLPRGWMFTSGESS
jgi:hypothetical protein